MAHAEAIVELAELAAVALVKALGLARAERFAAEAAPHLSAAADLLARGVREKERAGSNVVSFDRAALLVDGAQRTAKDEPGGTR